MVETTEIFNTGRYKQADYVALFQSTDKELSWISGVFNSNPSVLMRKFYSDIASSESLEELKIWWDMHGSGIALVDTTGCQDSA